MKTVSILLLLLFASALAPAPEIYQVISPHPHDQALIRQHSLTYHQHGRLWLVVPDRDAPAELMRSLRSIKGRDVRSFTPQLAPTKSTGNAQITSTLRQLQAQNIKAHVASLTGFKTRAAGTAENQAAVALVEKWLGEQGLELSRSCYKKGACSVVAERKGSEAPDQVILLLAHLDSVGKDFAGADDNASGTAVLMEIARVLKKYGNKKTIRFFATNGEELGLLGAKHYVKELSASGELKNIVLAINMDMVGYNSNGVVELETEAREEAMALWFAELARTYTSLKPKITLGAWGSDHVPFLKAGVPALLTIEDWSTKTPCYHLACDLPETLNYQYALEVARLNLAAMLTKDLD
jgi:hypothetical protein